MQNAFDIFLRKSDLMLRLFKEQNRKIMTNHFLFQGFGIRWRGVRFGVLAIACFSLGSCGVMPTLSNTINDLTSVSHESRKTAALRIESADMLNTDALGNPLSVVVHLYYLKDANRFMRATFESLESATQGREALGEDLIDSRELVAAPGARYESNELFPAGMRFFGIAAFFRTPDKNRWHYIFSASDVAKTGLAIGLHQCAMSFSQVKPVGEQKKTGANEINDSRCK